MNLISKLKEKLEHIPEYSGTIIDRIYDERYGEYFHTILPASEEIMEEVSKYGQNLLPSFHSKTKYNFGERMKFDWAQTMLDFFECHSLNPSRTWNVIKAND